MAVQMRRKIHFLLPTLLAIFCGGNALAFPENEMIGAWSGEAVNQFYRGRKTIPDYYRVTTMKINVDRNSRLTASTGDGCVFEGLVMRTYSTLFPVRGLVKGCPVDRMNGNFDGMFNKNGEVHFIVRDAMLGHTKFYGKMSPSGRIN